MTPKVTAASPFGSTWTNRKKYCSIGEPLNSQRSSSSKEQIIDELERPICVSTVEVDNCKELMDHQKCPSVRPSVPLSKLTFVLTVHLIKLFLYFTVCTNSRVEAIALFQQNTSGTAVPLFSLTAAHQRVVPLHSFTFGWTGVSTLFSSPHTAVVP